MKLTELLKTIRKQHGLTQAEMAKCLGITSMAVSRWERGERRPDGAGLAALLLEFPEHNDDILEAMVLYEA